MTTINGNAIFVTSSIDKKWYRMEEPMKEYEPSNLSVEELKKEIERLEEESKHMTEWPDIDSYIDD
mgnify:CR=1 FL=1